MKIDPTNIESVTLRPATAADAAALALVGAATFLEAFTWMLPGPDIIAHCAKHHTAEAYAAYLAKPDTRITLVVAGDDVPVGFAMVCTPDFPIFDVLSTDIELKRIYLFSRFRSAATPVTNAPGQRPADALMTAAIANARELGATRLLLGTHDSNERAIHFYKRHHFEVVGTRTFQVGTQFCNDHIFGRSL